MTTSPLYPFRFEPILKRLIWGGRRLETLLNKTLGEGSDYAESWEVSDHGDDVSQVADGSLMGATLRDLLRTRGEELLGPALSSRSQFPLLVKFLDAHQDLSVQVHPDDATATRLANDNGKTEAWVIVHAEPGSLIYAGLREGTTRAQFAEAMDRGEVEPLLHRFEVREGDSIFVPAGTVHAIGAGIVLAEVQQMSDATFRIFDWGRLGAEGRPRPLHRDEALASIDFDRGPVHPLTPRLEPITGGTREPLVHCPYFALERLRLEGPALVGSSDRFTILIGLEGAADIGHEATGASYTLERGQTRLLPAAIGACEVVPRDRATILSCRVPS